MTLQTLFRHATIAIVLSSPVTAPFALSAYQDGDDATVQILPNTGQQLTPIAPKGARFEALNPGLADFPDYIVGQAVTTVVSPDNKTLLILTSGYNLLNATSGPNLGNAVPADSNEYVFVYDISSNNIPTKKQVLQIPNTYNGITFDPNGKSFYVAGGVDDNVHIYDAGASGWAERSTSPIKLGHTAGLGLAVQPEAAGLAISGNGKKLAVANYYNDSVSVLQSSPDTNSWTVAGELDLRPGKINPANAGKPGGAYPFWISIKGNDTAYISSIRDREIEVVNISGAPSLISRIKLTGQPLKMTMNAAQTRLYVAEDETDSVAVIDTGTNRVLGEIPVGAPQGLLPPSRSGLTGNNTNSVTLSKDEKTLYVTNGNTNNVSVVELLGNGGYASVLGLIPTGWYPNSISLSGDGKYMYVVNGKSPTGPNPGNCHGDVVAGRSAASCGAANQYSLQLIKAGFQSFPIPNQTQLGSLTRQVATNNHYKRVVSAANQAKMAALRSNIKHVIYIIKENRTYDQILGDLEVGNGDPDLVEFGQGTTPNLHDLARNFVTLDNFYDASEVSFDGWPWSTSARAPDVVERQVTVNYAGRGLSNDAEGTNRGVNVGIATSTARVAANPVTPSDPDLLPGTTDTAAPDGPDNEVNTGYIWNSALRAGLSVRSYGFFIDLTRYFLPAAYSQFSLPLLPDPHASNTTVAYSTNVALAPLTDPFFRGFDNAFPDYYRFQEWLREFNTNYSAGNLPALSLVRLMHDHTGSFSTAIDGVNTPELQVADNDYAVGLLVQTIANSQYKNNTLIFVIEDDSQDGGDHVDQHRSIAYVIGPYVKHNAVISSAYNTIDFLRTIEDVLGLPQLNLNDSAAVPMADLFNLKQTDWSYTATPSSLLANTTLPIDPSLFASLGADPLKPTHNSAYWAQATKGMDFSAEDRIDFNRYNHVLWQGLKGNQPYPEASSGLDLRMNRTELLSRYRQTAGVKGTF